MAPVARSAATSGGLLPPRPGPRRSGPSQRRVRWQRVAPSVALTTGSIAGRNSTHRTRREHTPSGVAASRLCARARWGVIDCAAAATAVSQIILTAAGRPSEQAAGRVKVLSPARHEGRKAGVLWHPSQRAARRGFGHPLAAPARASGAPSPLAPVNLTAGRWRARLVAPTGALVPRSNASRRCATSDCGGTPQQGETAPTVPLSQRSASAGAALP